VKLQFHLNLLKLNNGSVNVFKAYTELCGIFP